MSVSQEMKYTTIVLLDVEDHLYDDRVYICIEYIIYTLSFFGVRKHIFSTLLKQALHCFSSIFKVTHVLSEFVSGD